MYPAPSPFLPSAITAGSLDPARFNALASYALVKPLLRIRQIRRQVVKLSLVLQRSLVVSRKLQENCITFFPYPFKKPT